MSEETRICRDCGTEFGKRDVAPSCWRRRRRQCRKCHGRRVNATKKRTGPLKGCRQDGCDRRRSGRNGYCALHLHRRYGSVRAAMDAPVLRRHCPEPTVGYAEQRRWAMYRLLPSQYRRLLDQQAGRCACCGNATKLEVEHDHEGRALDPSPQDVTRIRGLVCRFCNQRVRRFEARTLRNLQVVPMVGTYLARPRPLAG